MPSAAEEACSAPLSSVESREEKQEKQAHRLQKQTSCSSCRGGSTPDGLSGAGEGSCSRAPAEEVGARFPLESFHEVRRLAPNC